MRCQYCRCQFRPQRTTRARFCSPRCRVAAHRAKTALPTSSVVLTDNGDLISTALRLHLRRVDPLVADVTYGRGLFWRRHNGVRRLIGSDIRALRGIAVQTDFRALPYRDNYFDAVVLDPPYLHDPGAHHSTDARYGAATMMGAATHDDILDLYRGGITEAARVLKRGGLLLLKCQDEIIGGRQRWSHIELKVIAAESGFVALDLLILAPRARVPIRRRSRQVYARKAHSFLWCLHKP
jgi:hypothetical protein